MCMYGSKPFLERTADIPDHYKQAFLELGNINMSYKL